MRPPTKLAQKQIERRLQSLRAGAKDAVLRTGWISYMRQAMCMTQSVLAKMAGLNQSSVLQIEKRISTGSGELNIDSNLLVNGIYYVNIIFDGNMLTKKIIITSN